MILYRQVALAAALALQFSWHAFAPSEGAEREALRDPPGSTALRLASLGETIMMSRFMMLDLQSFDIQPDSIVPYRDLDYGKVRQWLKASQDLDERDSYPLFAATYLYLGVDDPARKRKMLDFIYRKFLENPAQRWQWLARAALVAKYELHDLRLALEYSEALRANGTADMPDWAREMSVFTLEDMNELEGAKVLLGGLLVSGKIRDANEIEFLKRELEKLSEKQAKKDGHAMVNRRQSISQSKGGCHEEVRTSGFHSGRNRHRAGDRGAAYCGRAEGAGNDHPGQDQGGDFRFQRRTDGL